MAKTNEFNKALKDYFDADCGAYTSITAEEINKQTFNVKATIRNLLISKVGRENIPAQGAKSSTMSFMLSEDLAKRFDSPKEISCKFSKPNKNEMTIYFSSETFIPKSSLSEGDYWCIYFKEGSEQPWFGYLNESVMDYIQQFFTGEIEIEPDEVDVLTKNSSKVIKTITYSYEVENLTIENIEPPYSEKLLSKPKIKKRDIPFTVSATNADILMKNKKIKGNRGEEIVIRIEKEKLESVGRADLAKKVNWRAKLEDGLGYDIESWETDENGENERQIFIEVKSTSRGFLEPFFISSNEVEVSKIKGDDYFIYRVYNLKPTGENVGYYRIVGNVESNFNLVPQTYVAFLK